MTPADIAHMALTLRLSDPAELARAARCSIADAVRALALANQPHSAVVLTPAQVASIAGATYTGPARQSQPR